MGRALKILAYAVVFFLTYLVITSFLKSCNNSNNVVADKVVSEEVVGNEDDYFEDGEGGESEGKSEDEFWGGDSSDNIDYNEIDKAVEDNINGTSIDAEVDYTTPPAETTSTTDYSSKPSSSSDGGNFMVIAGSYIINTNAENMVLKLKRLGYDKSEIVVFDMSQYHTVVASRSYNYDDALGIANELKSKGVDCYVHNKKG